MSFCWLPGQCKNYQQNSFLAPSAVELCMGCALEQFVHGAYKSQRFIISEEKAGSPSFVVYFLWLPGQCEKYLHNFFLAPSSVELCMRCALEQFDCSRVQKSEIPISVQKAASPTFVASFIWLPGQCKNYQENSFLAPSPVELYRFVNKLRLIDFI